MDANIQSRRKTSIISLLLTCVFLFLAIELSNGSSSGFATKINKITDSLNRAVLSLTSSINYTDYQNDAVYHNQTTFHPKGMAGLYNLTRMFINLIYPEDILMDGIVSIENSQIKFNDNIDYAKVSKYYLGILIVVILLVVFALFFPLCGLCFCLCRCCGNCGARSQPSGKKKDLCAKLVQGTLLIVLATGLLFCVVCAFGSNHQLNEGVNTFTKDIRKNVNDTKSYLDTAQAETRHLLVKNYAEFVDVFDETLGNSSAIVTKQLEEFSKAIQMSKLANFVTSIPSIKGTFFLLKDNTNQLRVFASQLNDALRKVKKDLLGTLNSCTLDPCEEIRNNISQLSTQIDFNKLPDVTEEISQLNSISFDDMHIAAQKGIVALENIRKQINSVLSSGIADARKQISSANSTIQDSLNNIDQVVDDVRDQIKTTSDDLIGHADNYVSEYWQYVYYAGIGISCVLLLATICIALGLTCGICGKRPDGYGDNCCNKGAGSQFLICAVMIMFFSGFFFAVLSLAMFLSGTLSDKVICSTLRNHNLSQSNLVKIIDDQLAKQPDIDLRISQILHNCHNNMSLYRTFNITKFDIEDIKRKFNVSKYLDKFNFDGIDLNVEILDKTSKENIAQLESFNLDYSLDKFKEELQHNFTNQNLEQIIGTLNNIISQLEARGDTGTVAELQLSVLHINTYNEKLLKPMNQMADDVLNNVATLEEQLKMGYKDFPTAISSLLQDISEAETTLREHGKPELQELAKNFSELVLGQVQSYIDRVADNVQYEIGKCAPLSSAINSTLTTTCDKVLMPWNGFWFSLFLTLVLYVVIIIISVRLASLYQKYKPYGHYVEAEYLYDAYADRGDSVPLNSSRGGKRGKKKGKKSKRHEERAPNGEVVAREYTSGSHPPDARYGDMAPKHWEEFPNGGPPQYQRAPTEYERPPPYYYPGNGGEH